MTQCTESSSILVLSGTHDKPRMALLVSTIQQFYQYYMDQGQLQYPALQNGSRSSKIMHFYSKLMARYVVNVIF